MQVLYHLDANDNIVGKTVDEEYIRSQNGFANFMKLLGAVVVLGLVALGGTAFLIYVGLAMLADLLR